MKKWMGLVLVILSLVFPVTILADECMEGDCDNGYGTGFTEDNKIYEGEWKDGLPHGQGTLYLSKGKVVEGMWEKGELVKVEAEEKENDTKSE
jgi:hypothetical protein